jgi:hypothetical protein
MSLGEESKVSKKFSILSKKGSRYLGGKKSHLVSNSLDQFYFGYLIFLEVLEML